MNTGYERYTERLVGDGQLRLIEQGITKVIGLLGALPIESEGEAA